MLALFTEIIGGLLVVLALGLGSWVLLWWSRQQRDSAQPPASPRRSTGSTVATESHDPTLAKDNDASAPLPDSIPEGEGVEPEYAVAVEVPPANPWVDEPATVETVPVVTEPDSMQAEQLPQQIDDSDVVDDQADHQLNVTDDAEAISTAPFIADGESAEEVIQLVEDAGSAIDELFASDDVAEEAVSDEAETREPEAESVNVSAQSIPQPSRTSIPPRTASAAPTGGKPGGAIPPRRSQSQTAVPPIGPSTTKSPSEMRARPIPPRRSRAMESMSSPQNQAEPAPVRPNPIEPSVTDFASSSAAIELPPTSPTQQESGTREEMPDEVAQLQLALEASHHELSHLTVARDQALSLVSQQESQMSQLQQQIQQIQAEQANLQQDRASLDELVAELKQSNSGLQAELESARSDAQRSAQNQESLDELRSILGQREATEASLLRERDSLQEQNAELQRKLQRLEQDASNSESPWTSPANDPSTQQIQQLTSELSLANETIRQLNQNMSHRDVQLVTLRRDHSTLQQEVAELRSAAEGQPGTAPDSDSLVTERDEAQAQLRSANERLIKIEQGREGVTQELEDARLQLDDNRQKLASMTNELGAAQVELTAAKEELEGLKSERETAKTQLEVARKGLSEATQGFESKLASVTDDRDQLLVERKELAEGLRSLEVDLEDVGRDVEVLEQRAAQLEQERDAALEQGSQLDRAKKELEAGLQAERQRAADLPTVDQLAALQRTVDETAKALDLARTAERTLEQRVQTEQAQRAGLEASLEELRSSTAAGTSEQQERTAQLAAQVAQYESELTDRLGQLEGLQSEKQSLLDRVGALQEEINAKAADMRRMGEQLTSAEEKAESAEQQASVLRDSEQATQRLEAELQTKDADQKRIQAELIELKQQLAHLTDAQEAWNVERSSLVEQLESTQSDVVERQEDVGAAVDEETLAEMQRLKTALADRDQAFRKLQQKFEQLQTLTSEREDCSVLHDDATDIVDQLRADRDQAAASAAEASATIARLMSELNQTTSTGNNDAELAKLQEENRQYRQSVAELHAVSNELEELQRERARERESARQRLQEATAANADITAELAELKQQLKELEVDDGKVTEFDDGELNTELESARGQLQQREDRLAELTAELSKLHSENAALRSQMNEQQAVQRTQGANGDAAEKIPQVQRLTKVKADSSGNKKPKWSKSKRPAKVDDLKQIHGIGPVIEKRLNKAGIYTFEQIMVWTKAEIRQLNESLSLEDRISRDQWVKQARQLAKQKKK